jgi:hypothetical protein
VRQNQNFREADDCGEQYDDCGEQRDELGQVLWVEELGRARLLFEPGKSRWEIDALSTS